MVYLNETSTIGIMLGNATQTTTGSIFLTMLILVIIIMALFMMFGVQLEYSSVLILPLLLALAAHYSQFMSALGAFFIYIAVVIAKNWFLR